MVLVVATDPQPIEAFRRLFSRIGFVLLPASVLLIKYYPGLGQGFDEFGNRTYIGVTTNKNILGNLAFIMVLAALWQTLSLLRNRKAPNRTRRLLAQCALLGFGINLLCIAQCATAITCCVLGGGLMLATSMPLIRYKPAAVHALIFIVLLGGGLMFLLGGRAAVTEALGRKPDLTGRTEIWDILIPMAPNPIGGAGFETFWMGPRVERIFELVGGPQMTNEAHNGYIEVYLNLGFFGLALSALILGQGYRTTFRAFRRDRGFGALLLAYVVTAVTYNVSEAGFRMLGMEWFVLQLSIMVASRTAGIAKYAPQRSTRLPDSGSVAEAIGIRF
jgi:O-antigen ligase